MVRGEIGAEDGAGAAARAGRVGEWPDDWWPDDWCTAATAAPVVTNPAHTPPSTFNAAEFTCPASQQKPGQRGRVSSGPPWPHTHSGGSTRQCLLPSPTPRHSPTFTAARDAERLPNTNARTKAQNKTG